jgi:hypothetical protein
MEARAQLLEYRRWFDDARHRASLVQKIGMEVYAPKLIVIIGRSIEFRDALDRQKLTADNPDLEVVTYDDILHRAKERRMIILNHQ